MTAAPQYARDDECVSPGKNVVLGANDVGQTLSLERKALALAAHGIRPGPSGYDLDAVLEVIAAHGFGYSTTPPTSNAGRAKRWRATVFGEGLQMGRSYHGVVRGSRAMGPSEGDALAIALATLLAQQTASS